VGEKEARSEPDQRVETTTRGVDKFEQKGTKRTKEEK